MAQSAFDEAGDTGLANRSSRHLVVAGIVCASLEPLRRAAAQARKSFGKQLRDIPELKGQHSTAKLTAKFLARIAVLDVEIYAAVLDKHSAKLPDDTEDWYRRTYAEAVRQALARHDHIVVTMDNRYTKAALRDKLTLFVAAHAQRAGSSLSFVYADSQREKALQAADAVAWSIYQKYERGDDTFYRLIEEKVVGETLLLR